ncbi:hypothetical protein PANO111632_13115 [Paracoccus nototheniae]|uniref:Uncharacterized protein n=1 Tax=Paracoccus nototheniae TaxID=2489002 RepID=A0ABW4E3E6_9RHOB|nr:hypothetical protein [Paracoccus nototheniae]
MTRIPNFPWMNPDNTGKMIRKYDLHLFGCLHVLADIATPDGEIAYGDAVDRFANTPEVDQQKAIQFISRLLDAGWVIQKGETLSIVGYGSKTPPDYTRSRTD